MLNYFPLEKYIPVLLMLMLLIRGGSDAILFASPLSPMVVMVVVVVYS